MFSKWTDIRVWNKNDLAFLFWKSTGSLNKIPVQKFIQAIFCLLPISLYSLSNFYYWKIDGGILCTIALYHGLEFYCYLLFPNYGIEIISWDFLLYVTEK